MKAENVTDSTIVRADYDSVARGQTIIANTGARKLVPGFGGRIAAALVWDGTDEVRIPEAMGKPSEGQMQGTARERLVELSGRVCYDSLGSGRKSPDYHANIIKINHGALWEHAALTIETNQCDEQDALGVYQDCANKPSLYIREVGGRMRITLNLRHAVEWKTEDSTGNLARWHAHKLAPLIVSPPGRDYGGLGSLVEPETDEEKWVTLYLTGSRGWSHELVRHGDWTAISQRSTRYVDESESGWVMHPLIAQFVAENPGKKVIEGVLSLEDALDDSYLTGKERYDTLVAILQPWLEAKGIDKFSARKQARGAARGLLGNALETEVIFSFNVAQGRHMLNMRAADAADAEIRLGFAEAVLPCLRACRYGDRFADFVLAPAKDGIGRSLAGGGAK